MTPHLLFQHSRYEQMGAKLREGYTSADPYPHAVIDDFLPPEVLEQVLGEFPTPEQIAWMKFERHHSKKLATQGAAQFGNFTRDLLGELNGSGCLHWLETVTGIEGLIPDPHFVGGGLHQIPVGRGS